MNLWQKIVEVRKSIGELNKDKSGFNFSYVTGDQILAKIKTKMDELGLILQPSNEVGKWHRHDYQNKRGVDKIDFVVWGQAYYTWINSEKPEEREVVSFSYYGQQGDDLSQAYGTALTYAERYFLLKYFGLPTDGDDPDKRRQTQPPQSGNNAPQNNNNSSSKKTWLSDAEFRNIMNMVDKSMVQNALSYWAGTAGYGISNDYKKQIESKLKGM